MYLERIDYRGGNPYQVKPDEFIKDHRVIGPLMIELEQQWKETQEYFHSIKARQELLVSKFFQDGIFIPRHVIPATNVNQVITTIEQVGKKPRTFTGIRTAYKSNEVSSAPWVMQRCSETKEEFIKKAVAEYYRWMGKENNEIVPEAIIIMENPDKLGDSELKKDCFILRISMCFDNPNDYYCQLEGRDMTDQTRDLEETVKIAGKWVKNINFDPKKIFRGTLSFEITPYSIRPGNIFWDILLDDNSSTAELILDVKSFLFQKFDLPNLLAHLIALYFITDHKIIQIQGRRSDFQKSSLSPFDFFLGYNIRGAEEIDLIKQFVSNQKLKSWQIPFRE